MKLYAMPDPKKQELSETEFVYIYDFHIESPTKWETAANTLTKRYHLHGNNPIYWIEDTAYGPEAYRMEIQQNHITVRTGGVQGARYAVYMIMQAANALKLPVGVIEDYPDMDFRGFLLNLRGPLRYSSIETLCYYIRSCGLAKINTVLVEYDMRFNHGIYQPKNPWTLTEEEFNTLLECAEEEGITLIPLIQTYGHLSFLLSQPELKHLREEPDVFDQLCPLNPDSFEFAKYLIDLYVEKHPNLRYLHIGGDETRQLGACPVCSEFVKKHGKGGLYTHYINRVIEYVCSKGITPLVYDDMICTHPEAVKELDRRAVLVYWDYWTTSDPSPLLVARGGYDWAVVRDQSWDDSHFKGLPDVQRNIFKFFGKACNLDGGDLNEEYLKLYRPYLGDQFPRYVKAFPYLEYYHDQGFKVIAMPTALGNTDNYLGAPNQARFTANICAFAKRAVESKAMGMITSAWFRFPEAAYPFGITIGGQYAWGLPDYAEAYYTP